MVLVFARLVIFDMPFTAFVTAALWCLIRARIVGGTRWLVPAAGLAMAAATLTKGPVGVALPILAWVAARGALPPPRERTPRAAILTAVGLFVATVGSWMIVVIRQEPAFLRYAFVDETFLRFASTARFHRGAPAYYYLPTIAWALGPWCAMLAASAPELVRRARTHTPEAVVLRFAARAAVAMVLFFTLSASKRPQYILPALVPLALLCALGIAAAPARTAAALRGLAVVAIAIGAACIAAGGVGIGMHGMERSAVSPVVLEAGGGFLVVWALLAISTRRAGPLTAIVCAALFAPGMGCVLLGPLTPWADGRSARTLAGHIGSSTTVVSFEAFRTSLPFYLRRPVLLVSDSAGELTSNYVCDQRARLNDGKNLAPATALPSALARDGSAYVITRPSRLKRLAALSTEPLRPVYADTRTVLLQR